MIQWGRPEALAWLIPWVLAGWWFARARKAKENQLAELIEPALWEDVVPDYNPKSARWPWRLRFLALGLIILALARPHWGWSIEEARQWGLQIVVALDVSNSMLASDLKPSRLQQAKWGIRDFLQRVRGDRVAQVGPSCNVR